MGDWTITATFGEWQFGQKDWTWIKADRPRWADSPVGGGVVAQLDKDTFLVAGDFVRFSIGGRKGGPENGMILRVEEGSFVSDRWVMRRIWNGDQTDYGPNFLDRPQLLKVTMANYR